MTDYKKRMTSKKIVFLFFYVWIKHIYFENVNNLGNKEFLW